MTLEGAGRIKSFPWKEALSMQKDAKRCKNRLCDCSGLQPCYNNGGEVRAKSEERGAPSSRVVAPDGVNCWRQALHLCPLSAGPAR